MQATMSRPQARNAADSAPSFKGIGRAVRYLTNYKRQAALPYIFLIIATLSQLAVPRMVRNVIDAVTSGYIADQMLEALDKIPADFVGAALPKILEAPEASCHSDGRSSSRSSWMRILRMRRRRSSPPWSRSSSSPSCAVVFSFLQAFWAEKNSQAVAYDLRNDLYAKIQNLSFSYHDKNQTGQLMIRATDDVEKVRLFIGQGLLQLVGAVILLTGTIIILFTTNAALAWTAMPILPVAIVLFIIFASLAQPMFTLVQQKLSALEHRAAGKPGGHQGHQGLHPREGTADQVPHAPRMPPWTRPSRWRVCSRSCSRSSS